MTPPNPEAHLDRLSELCESLGPESRAESLQLIEHLREAKRLASKRQRALSESQAEAIVNAGMMMSELEDAHAELDRARQAAEAASTAKSQFLANMSHEIRTPMNGVLGMLQLVLESTLESKQRDRLETAYRSAQSLLILLNDILEFSKLEAGRVELERQAFSLANVVEDIGALFEPQCRRKHIALVCDIEDRVGAAYLGDAHRIRQVINNLVGNAVKFTTHGEVRIELRLTGEDPAGDGLRIDIRDTGIGIPEDRIGQLFKQFSQLDASTSRRFGGTGLGLAISAQLAQLMGGSLVVRSSAGEGSTFSLLLSLPRSGTETIADLTDRTLSSNSPATTASTVDPVQRGSAFARARVLLVEDNLVNRTLAVAMLELYELEIDCADNGHEALGRLGASRYDLVLMDCQMPELDGYEATRRWRQQESQRGLAPVPIIALTANAMHGDRETCLAAGMNDYLAKPFTREALTEALQRWLPRASRDAGRAVA